MQRGEEVRPDLPVAPAPKAPKKKGKAVKIVGIIVGGLIVLSAIGAALPIPKRRRQRRPSRRRPTPPMATSRRLWTNPQLRRSRRSPSPRPRPRPVEPEFTAGQENAISAAKSYLDYTAFSKSGLIDQLKFEKYSASDARFAVNHITVDWNEQAAKSAQSYLDYSSFSRQGLIDQLEFEGFTTQQATHGVNTTGL